MRPSHLPAGLTILVLSLAPLGGAGCNCCIQDSPPPSGLLSEESSAAEAAGAQDGAWSDLKGRVVFGGKDLPAPMVIDAVNLNKDKDHCLSKGPLVNEEWVINKENKGVRWAVVWLQAEEAGTALPVHPDLKAAPKTEVTMDQPFCKFEPRVVALQQGQVLVAKNSAEVAHNYNYAGFPPNRGDNKLMPAGSTLKIDELKASPYPVTVSCAIHTWMKGYIRIFNHPYFAVTDADGKFEIKKAPAGKYRLVIWHETGFRTDKTGEAVEIKPGTTDLGTFELKK